MLRIVLRLLLRLRGVHQDKYLLQLHNTRISFGMFTAVVLFFPPTCPFFRVQTCKATRRMPFFSSFFLPVPDRCGVVWFQHHSRLRAGGWGGGNRGSALREEESGG